MFSIAKRFSFSASHVLDHLPDGHPCARLHGHNYEVEVVVKSHCLDDRGFCAIDYRELDAFKARIDAELDHRHLNDVVHVRTTAENLAKLLYGWAKAISPAVSAVRVSETPKTWATYEGPA